MSGRIRTIKPELLEDAVTAGLSNKAFRLFVGCILLADDYGNLRFEPAWVQGQIFWKQPINGEDLIAAMREVEALIQPYEVKGQRYGAIKNWEKHQKVTHKGKPRVPPRPETLPPPSGNSPETLLPDLRSPTKTPTPTPTGEGPKGSSSETSFATGTAGALEAKSAFESAVAEATGAKFALPRAPFHLADLCDLLNAFAEGESKATKLAWLQRVVAEWVRSADGKSTAGWQPTKLQNWLNGGRPSSRQLTARGAEITKQGFEPDAPWMKLGEAG